MSEHLYDKILNELQKDGTFLEKMIPSPEDVAFTHERIINILESSFELY